MEIYLNILLNFDNTRDNLISDKCTWIIPYIKQYLSYMAAYYQCLLNMKYL